MIQICRQCEMDGKCLRAIKLHFHHLFSLDSCEIPERTFKNQPTTDRPHEFSFFGSDNCATLSTSIENDNEIFRWAYKNQ